MITTEVRSADASAIKTAAELLRQSKIVAMPTETVYGLAGIATDETALMKIFAAKERPLFDPLIVHVAPLPAPTSASDLFQYLEAESIIDLRTLTKSSLAAIEKLADRYWPGPLTLVLPRGKKIPDLATSGLDTVGIRMPAHPVAQALIEVTGSPLAAPSANRFGRISPTSADDVLAELGGRIPLILDGGACSVGVESTVLFIHPEGGATELRPGGITQAEWQTFIAPQNSELTSPASTLNHPRAPGQLASHYAPRKPLTFLPLSFSKWTKTIDPAITAAWLGKKIGLLSFLPLEATLLKEIERKLQCQISEQRSLNNSQEPNLPDAAKNLFRSLRALDQGPAEHLIAEAPPTLTGLGFAIADRLQRAATR